MRSITNASTQQRTLTFLGNRLLDEASLTTAILFKSLSGNGVLASHSANETFFAGELDVAREGKLGRRIPDGVEERDIVGNKVRKMSTMVRRMLTIVPNPATRRETRRKRVANLTHKRPSPYSYFYNHLTILTQHNSSIYTNHPTHIRNTTIPNSHTLTTLFIPYKFSLNLHTRPFLRLMFEHGQE